LATASAVASPAEVAIMKIKWGWALGAVAMMALVGATSASAGTSNHEDPGATPAPAHSTGHESRSNANCELLPGTQTDGERGWCLKCMAIGHTHYHPDCPAKHRCNIDNGKQDCNQQPPGWGGN
jgi:hypothetical protein